MRSLLFLSVLILSGTALSQNITISKDSLWVNNSMAFSRSDELVLKNTSSDTARLDSAFIEFDVLDTTGLTYPITKNLLQMAFIERYMSDTTAGPHRYMSMTNLGNNIFRLNNANIGTTIQPQFTINPFSENFIIYGTVIGYCLVCGRYPLYPKYLHGKLLLFFNNHQKVIIKLYSTDLRPVAVQISGPHTKQVAPPLMSNSFLLDGRKIVGEAVQKNGKKPLIQVYRFPVVQKNDN